MPANTLLTLQIENQDIPILFSQLCIEGQVLDHPAVIQRQEIPQLEHDPDLNMLIQGSVTNTPSSDPNGEITADHVLAPLVERATHYEQAMIAGPSKVNYES